MRHEAAGIERFAALIPTSLLRESGKVFYSGRKAYSSAARLYVLGVNPGGDPANHAAETVGEHTRQVLHDLPADWSAYRDDVWEGARPGTHGMAPRVLHLFKTLGLEPGSIPASNLFFVRSRREEHIKGRQRELSDLCWPFHARVLEELKPRAVLCLGATAGGYVRRRLGANRVVAHFVEQNDRRWKSQVFDGARGIRVIVATHPSIADWCASSDPTGLVRDAIR
jgi:hypothetical protein